ncbi:MAG: YHS domain-containing protein [Labilithrix sp.]|nr:YHS domain-containing protein [Labilithrix sp.]
MIRHLIVVASVFAFACGEASLPTPPAAPSAPSEPSAPGKTGEVKAPGDANVGDTTKCPVSGEEFTVEATSQKVEHDGKTYYFCCGGCKKKFESDPAKYVKKS